MEERTRCCKIRCSQSQIVRNRYPALPGKFLLVYIAGTGTRSCINKSRHSAFADNHSLSGWNDLRMGGMRNKPSLGVWHLQPCVELSADHPLSFSRLTAFHPEQFLRQRLSRIGWR